MTIRTWHGQLILLIILCSSVSDNECSSPPWYENLPAVAMDYKFYVDKGKEDCYFQYVQPGASFHVSFSVLRGGDGMAGFAVRHPNGMIVHPYEWRASAEYNDATSTGGYYSVCVDNQFSRFASKLVNLYLTVIRYDQWEKLAKDMEDTDMNIANFSMSLENVERNINNMRLYQHHSRSRESRDFNLLSDNNAYVMRWSLIQIAVIGLTSGLQVYFLRKLFDIDDKRRSRI